MTALLYHVFPLRHRLQYAVTCVVWRMELHHVTTDERTTSIHYNHVHHRNVNSINVNTSKLINGCKANNYTHNAAKYSWQPTATGDTIIVVLVIYTIARGRTCLY